MNGQKWVSQQTKACFITRMEVIFFKRKEVCLTKRPNPNPHVALCDVSMHAVEAIDLQHSLKDKANMHERHKPE